MKSQKINKKRKRKRKQENYTEAHWEILMCDAEKVAIQLAL